MKRSSRSTKTQTYVLRMIPDAHDAVLQSRHPRGVGPACVENARLFTTLVSAFQPGSAVCSRRYHFVPTSNATLFQNRLTIEQVVGGVDKRSACLIGRTVWEPCCCFQASESCLAIPPDITCCADVARYEEFVEPLVSQCRNHRAPRLYYMPSAFKPADVADWAALDRMLHLIDKPVVIDVTIKSDSAEQARAATRRYEAYLESINQQPRNTRPISETLLRYATGTPESNVHDIVLPQDPDLLAKQISRSIQMRSEQLRHPQVRFSLRIFACDEVTASTIATALARCLFGGGPTRTVTTSDPDEHFQQASTAFNSVMLHPTPSLIASLKSSEFEFHRELLGCTSLASIDEIAIAFQAPFSAAGSYFCIRRNTDPPVTTKHPSIVLGVDQEPVAGTDGPRLSIAVNDILKHLLLCGMSGSAKSSLVMSIAIQLHALGIPFLVLESGRKREYRRLLNPEHTNPELRRLAQEIRIVTPGNEGVSPLRMNPFDVEDWTDRDVRMENIQSILRATIDLEEPLGSIIGEANENLMYSNTGAGLQPVLANLVECAFEVLRDRGYAADIRSNLHGAVHTRIKDLTRRGIGKVFQCPRTTPSIESFFAQSTIVELGRLPNYLQSMVILLLLTGITEYLASQPTIAGTPKLVIFIEEAHNLMAPSSGSSAAGRGPDPVSETVELICGMLAECRAKGVGICVIDQSPSAVDRRVIQHTAIKCVGRQVDADDRQQIGAAMGLSALQIDQLSRLGPGEMFLSTEDLPRPRLVKTMNITKEMGIGKPPIDQTLAAFIHNQKWHQAITEERAISELARLESLHETFERNIQLIAGRAPKTEASARHAIGKKPASLKDAETAIAGLKAIAREMQKQLLQFERDGYIALSISLRRCVTLPAALAQRRDALLKRMDTHTKPQIERACERITRTVAALREDLAKEFDNA